MSEKKPGQICERDGDDGFVHRDLNQTALSMPPLLSSRFAPEHERKRSRKYACGYAHPLGNDEAVHDDFPSENEAENMRERKNCKYDDGDS